MANESEGDSGQGCPFHCWLHWGSGMPVVQKMKAVSDSGALLFCHYHQSSLPPPPWSLHSINASHPCWLLNIFPSNHCAASISSLAASLLCRHHHPWGRASCWCPHPAIAIVIMGHHHPSPFHASWPPTFWGHVHVLLSLSTAKTAPRRWMRWRMRPTRRTWFDCLDRGWPYHQKIPIAKGAVTVCNDNYFDKAAYARHC